MTVGVCGIGQIGLGVALAASRAGFRVLVYGRNAEKLRQAEGRLEKLNEWTNQHLGSLETKSGTVTYVGELAELDAEADLIVEGIAEDLNAKVALFRQLDGCVRRGGVLATATSGLSITELGECAGCGGQLVGAHFWNPPHLMPLVEVVRGEHSNDAAIETVVEFVRAIGKIPVRVNKDVPGFIGNRMLHALWREAIDLVDHGIASPEDVDLVAKLTFGLRMPVVGPLENMDLVGLDLIKTIHDYLLPEIADNHVPSAMLSRWVREQRWGMKSKQGFYDWTRRDPQELIERRDRQIVEQLQKLRVRGRQSSDREDDPV